MTSDHQPLPSVEDHLCRDRVAVLQQGLYLFTGCIGSTVSRVVPDKSATTCVLPGATLNELYSSLQMAATCTGLGGSQVKPSHEP